MVDAAKLDQACRDLDAYAATLDEESRVYWHYHRHRFRWMGEVVEELVAEKQHHGFRPTRLLDIGNSYQTLLIESLIADARIDTLGFLAPRYQPKGEFTDIPFDLNDSFYPERWPKVPEPDRYDIVLMLEVIEHLYTAPTQVLACLASLMKPGGFIVVQTPNAVSLVKRLRMLGGRNPYELIREVRNNPGHFREYSRDELCHLAAQAGLFVKHQWINNLIDYGNRFEDRCAKLSRMLPATFRDNLTVVFEYKPELLKG